MAPTVSPANGSLAAKISISCCSVAIVVACGSWALGTLLSPPRQLRDGDLTGILIFSTVWLMPYFANIVAAVKVRCHADLSRLLLIFTSVACGGRLFFFLCVVIMSILDQASAGSTFAGLVEFCILCVQMLVSLSFFLIASVLQKTFRVRPSLTKLPIR
jgi:hypothetical protein